MKLHYFPDTDSLCIDLAEKANVDFYEIVPGVILDFGADGNLAGINIENASKIVDLSRLEAEPFPWLRYHLRE